MPDRVRESEPSQLCHVSLPSALRRSERRISARITRSGPWIAVAACLAVCSADAAPRLPADVAAFRASRAQCDHLRGEEPYDEERRKSLAMQLQRFCKGSDAALARLKKKYRKHRNISRLLNGYDARIE